MLDWIEPRLDDTLREQFYQAREAAQLPQLPQPQATPTRITELEPVQPEQSPAQPENTKRDTDKADQSQANSNGSHWWWLLALAFPALLGGGLIHGVYSGRKPHAH